MAREVEERRSDPPKEGLTDASRNPVSREAVSAANQQLVAELSPPHLDPLPLADFFSLGEDLALGVDLALGEGDWLGFGFAVLVLRATGAWVTSNCTSVGVDPSAAEKTW